MEFSKKMSKTGAVTLPAAMRRDLGLPERERFLIQPQPDGNILLRRVKGQCMFCKDDQKLITYEGRFICSNCITNMLAKEDTRIWETRTWDNQ